MKEDLRRGPDFDFSFVAGAYVQPELSAETEVLVGNMQLMDGAVVEGTETHVKPVPGEAKPHHLVDTTENDESETNKSVFSSVFSGR